MSAEIIIRRREVMRRTGYSYSHIWRLERAGLFPARVKLGPHSVGWVEAEIDAWVRSRIRGGCRPVRSTSSEPDGAQP